MKQIVIEERCTCGKLINIALVPTFVSLKHLRSKNQCEKTVQTQIKLFTHFDLSLASNINFL